VSDLPEFIHVLGVKYNVEAVEDLYLHDHVHDHIDGEQAHENMVKVHGIHDGDAGVILIEAKQKHPDVARRTLLHEVLHAAIFAAELDDILNPSDEERLVGRLSGVLYEVLKHNPRLLMYLEGE